VPWKSWSFRCGHFPSIRFPRCSECGAQGTYDGWRGSVVEMWCQYSRMYGLAPMGPHRGLASQVFEGTTKGCAPCGGRGFVDEGPTNYSSCQPCDGCGRIFVIPSSQIAALREAVLAAFPDAASPRRRAGEFPRLTGGVQ
jgi:hypothetical protein